MFELTPKIGLLAVLMMLLLLLSPVDSRWTRRPRRTTTPRTTTKKSDRHQHVHHWPPLVAPQPPATVALPATVQAPVQAPVVASEAFPSSPSVVWKPSLHPRLIDSFDRRSADGQYEFRFQLDNGNTRYERAYWLPVGKDLFLAKKGFYSVPLPNDQFSTIFYTADNRGYQVDKQTLSGERPVLPRSLEVPGVAPKMETGTGGAETKRNSISDPERNEQDVKDVDGDVDTSVAGTERVPDAVSQVETETETETETEPSTLANDILATEAAADSHVKDDDDDDDADADADDVDDEGDSN